MISPSISGKAEKLTKQIRLQFKKGRKYYEVGNFSRSLYYLKKLIDQIDYMINKPDDLDGLEFDLYYHTCRIYIYFEKPTLAYTICQRAQEIATKLQDDKQLITCLDLQGDIKILQGNTNSAYDNYLKSLTIKLNLYGDNNIVVSKSYLKIGEIFDNEGKYDQALNMYNRALTIDKNLLGSNHNDVATLYSKIGSIHDRQCKYDDALVMYVKALKIIRKKSNQKHSDTVAKLLSNIGTILHNQAKYDEALYVYKKSIKIYLKRYVKHHRDINMLYDKMGSIYYKQGQYNEALTIFNKVLKNRLLQSRFLQGDLIISDIITSCKYIGATYIGLGEYDKARTIYENSFRINLKFYLTEEHSDIIL
ncbi:Kinesin light chain [Trichoplax sp. H2]|nr:Kinesin light chain [Trichoplax sp. H2]|eukprot:RDD43987.1 Kinesin light chain [Trichoplax sp. H2]